MAVGSGRSTLGSEKRKELKRLPSMVATKLDCQLVQVLMFVVVLASLSLLLNMI